ncbi:hypothetical protein [Methylobacterium nodulans]|uniref:hypothetical protein n=1 Tax=Methylobacterium nodulans TaxID=114616 RepID=UPI0005C2221C|nr:hypothetical protein [Methylobacterium nodulans]
MVIGTLRGRRNAPLRRATGSARRRSDSGSCTTARIVRTPLTQEAAEIMTQSALVVGIVGNTLARHLLVEG